MFPQHLFPFQGLKRFCLPEAIEGHRRHRTPYATFSVGSFSSASLWVLLSCCCRLCKKKISTCFSSPAIIHRQCSLFCFSGSCHVRLNMLQFWLISKFPPTSDVLSAGLGGGIGRFSALWKCCLAARCVFVASSF